MSHTNVFSRRIPARFLFVFVISAFAAVYLLLPNVASMQSLGRDLKVARSEKFKGVAMADDGSADPTFNSGITYGKTLGAISATLSDGKILVGGTFSLINGAETPFLSRINADGTIDPTFNPGGVGPNAVVYDIALLAGGKFLISGGFTTYNGAPIAGLARINADGTLDASFNPGGIGVTGTAQTINLQADGKILISGSISGYNGTAKFSVIRVNSDGTLDTFFTSPFANNQFVEGVNYQPDGRIVISGAFSVGSYTCVARLNPNGSLDSSFNNGGGGVDNAGAVYGQTLQPDGKILITGQFFLYDGVPRPNIARLNADGTLDTGFVPPYTGGSGGEYFQVQTDGKILIAGRFNIFGSDYPLIRLNADGTADNTFSLNTTDSIGYNVKIQPDSKIILTGYFNVVAGVARRNIVRLNSNGSVDGTLNSVLSGFGAVNTIVRQSDGKILAAGDFEQANGAARSNIARFNVDGTLDVSFTPGIMTSDSSGLNRINAIAVQPDGKILAGGQFGGYSGSLRQSIVRLNSDGSLDTTFIPVDINGLIAPGVYDILVLSSGKILLGGLFQAPDFTARFVIRLNSDGSTDSSGFQQQPNSTVTKLALQTDGKIVIAGTFTTYFNGSTNVSRQRIARVSADGALDTTFNPTSVAAANASVLNLALQPDGKIVVGGSFTTFAGVARSRIARLNNDGSLDASFSPGTGFNGNVNAISRRTDGTILVGGRFSTYNGATANRLIRLNSDGTQDTSFTSAFDGDSRFFVQRTLLQPDGRLLVGGIFKSYGGATHLSLVRLTLNATTASVSGRVMTSDGRGVTNATVTLTGPGGVIYTAITNRTGAFTFANIPMGQTYTASVMQRRFSFTPQVIQVDDNVTDLNFLASAPALDPTKDGPPLNVPRQLRAE